MPSYPGALAPTPATGASYGPAYDGRPSGDGIGVIIPPALCSLPTLAQLFANQAVSTFSGIEVTSTRNVATDATASSVVSGDAATAFTSNSSIVQENFVYKSKVSNATDLNQGFFASIEFIDTVTFLPVCAVTLALRTQGVINTNNAIIDSLGGFTASDVLFDDIPVPVGYEIALAIDTNAGSASFKDSAGRSGGLKFSGSWNPANPLLGILSVATGTELNDQIVGDFNQGNQAFGVTIPNAVPWCQAV